MFMMLYDRAMAYAAQHVILVNTAHTFGGFGIAIVLQHYLKGRSFVPVWVGWLGIAFSVVVHIMAFMS